MKVGYVRVSSLEQHEARQLEAMKFQQIEKVFVDKASGKNTNRKQFQSMLEFVREGDSIVISDFSRLARSTKDLLAIVEQLEAKGVKLVSLKENLDTATATGKLMLTMIAAINEFERANMLERQREGIEIAKKQGVYTGRKAINYPANWSDIYSQWESRQINGAEAMQALGLKRNTFYKLTKKYQEEGRK